MAAKKNAFGDSYQRKLVALKTEFRGILGEMPPKFDSIADKYMQKHKMKNDRLIPDVCIDPHGFNGVKGVETSFDIPNVYIALASHYAGVAWPQGYGQAKMCLERAHTSLGAKTISEKDRTTGIKSLIKMAAKIAQHARDNYNSIADSMGEVNADRSVGYAKDIVDLASGWVKELPKPITTKKKTTKKRKTR
ncbi:MAG: hypothetical protein NTX24_00100 [Candidatus Pacearchaeota archaeon]|nr:hypothetical protein [Candidatus Pacearchaeota archaeon]